MIISDVSKLDYYYHIMDMLARHGSMRVKDICSTLVQELAIPIEEQNRTIPSGKPLIRHKIETAIHIMKQSNLITNVAYGTYEISDAGRLRLAKHKKNVSNEDQTKSTSDQHNTKSAISLAEALKDLEKALDDLLISLGGKTNKSDTESVSVVTNAKVTQKETDRDAKVSARDELNSLIGLAAVKNEVAAMAEFVKIQRVRKQNGMKSVPVSLHLVFTGNPGTGKTTIARIIAQLYKEIGVLAKGQLVEVERADLVAGYVGQTAIKTQAKIQEAMGGVLFIDEAYTLAKEGNDFGQEAIDTILKAMEDKRDQFVVIVAGYRNRMTGFINSNPGLKSRFSKYIDFPDYQAEELKQIFNLMCTKYEYKLDANAQEKAFARIDEIVASKDDNFANAREIRNLFEAVITRQAMRVGSLPTPTSQDLQTILQQDI